MFKFVHAKQPSDIVDPAKTMGIEVTDAAVANQCWLGNIDGQHGMNNPPEWQDKAAIQIAARLDVRVPPVGTTFATSRPDVDSVGAMAVLVIRAIGHFNRINQNIVHEISDADAFKPSSTWQPKLLPTLDNPWSDGAAPVDANPDTAYLGLICSPRRGDVTESMTLAQRILVLIGELAGRKTQYEAEQFLGEKLPALPTEWRESAHMLMANPWASLALHLVAESRRSLARAAQEPGAVIVDRSWWQVSSNTNLMPHCGPFETEQVALDNLEKMDLSADRDMYYVEEKSIAVIRVAHAGALGLGYCVAPVVVAIDPATERWHVRQLRTGKWGRCDAPGNKYDLACSSREDALALEAEFQNEIAFIGEATRKPITRVVRRVKATIAPYSPKHLDFVGLRAELNRLEAEAGGDPKWGGGTSGITGSPQNGGTVLPDDAIVNTVRRFLK